MAENDKLPRGHAYIRMRNRGYSIHIDYQERESKEAERIIEAAMEILREGLTASEQPGTSADPWRIAR